MNQKNISNHTPASNSDFVAGDSVVYVSKRKPDTIHCVKTVSTKFEYVVLDNTDVVNFDGIRPATVAELKAKKRLPEPVNSSPDLADIEKREFDLGLAPDDAYVKDEQLYIDRALKAQGEVS